ncbi:MAG: hypothetical protein J7559_12340 [Cohnella sp.]|nr:hypothetical protein [Cohnella sp.]
MQYNEAQLDTVAKELQRRFIAQEVTNYEIVVALFAMERAGKITAQDIRNILTTVFFFNTEAVIQALQSANQVIDNEMIDKIVEEVNQQQ